MFDHIPTWVPTWAIFLMALAGTACLTFWHWATFGGGREAREIRDVESLLYRVPAAGITVINRPQRLQPILCMHCHYERNDRLGLHDPFPAEARELTCHRHQVLLLEEQTRMLNRHNAERAERASWRPARLEAVTPAPPEARTPASVQPPHDIPLLFWASDGENGESVRAWTVQRLSSGGWVPPSSDDEDD